MNENTGTDQGIFVPNEDAASEGLSLQQEFDTTGEQCHKCGKIFKSGPALRMHNIRKHTKGWSTSANFKPRGAKWTLAQRRKFNKSVRARADRMEKLHHAATEKPAPTPKPLAVTFCPRCGCNMKVVAAAIAFGDKQ